MPNPPVTFPALFTPANAVAFSNADGTAQTVSAAAPLPVAISGSVGTQPISAVSLPLPTGAATSANQTATITSLSVLSGQLPATLGQKTMAQSLPVALASDTATIGVTVGNFPATQTVAAASLPLPAGAATAANQTAMNTSLSTISGQLPATLGQKTMAQSLPVALASDMAAIGVTVGNFPATQTVTAASLPLPAGAATAVNQTATNTSLSTISGQLPATLGQKTMAQSLPVALASDTAAIGVTVGNFPATQTVTAGSLPLPTGASTSANQASAIASIAAISGQLPASLGPKTSAASLSVGPASDIANLEPAAAAITGTTMPTGGTGLTGWLSAIYRSCSEGGTISGNVTSATTVVSSSNNLYMGGSFHVTNAGTTCTISYEQSNDGTNWVALPVVSAASATSAPTTTSTATGIYTFVSSAAFVRARVSSYTSGTVSVVLSQKQQVAPATGISLAAGSSSIGSMSVSGTTTIAGNVNAGTGFTDSTTALGASASFTGTGRANSAGQFAFFNATAFADQAGTLFIDQSLDTGATYQAIASQAVAAGGAANLSVRMCGGVGTATLYRVRYVNGATLQTGFRLSSSFSAS